MALCPRRPYESNASGLTAVANSVRPTLGSSKQDRTELFCAPCGGAFRYQLANSWHLGDLPTITPQPFRASQSTRLQQVAGIVSAVIRAFAMSTAVRRARVTSPSGGDVRHSRYEQVNPR